MRLKKRKLLLFALSVAILTCFIAYFHYLDDIRTKKNNASYLYYEKLHADTYDEDPLAYIDENFQMKEGFTSNLPLVVISLDSELTTYKKFTKGEQGDDIEVVLDAEPWSTGSIQLYRQEHGRNSPEQQPIMSSNIKIKKRGHTSMAFDKMQYSIKLVDENGNKCDQDVFGMGVDDEWILNGSMADKSMIRNYLAYNISSHIMNYAPRSCYCEVFINEEGKYIYQGVYLMMDTIKQSKYRVDIDASRKKNSYSSYLVRRDRYTAYDTMLDTYGRIAGYDDAWIGVKYPSEPKQNDKKIKYIQDDFSKIEKVMYSDNDDIFKTYDRYIDVDSFVDYFLINEYFGNYDAGEHSTYMYKNQGETLKIGPVWDFDQAMNNSVVDEADSLTLAMQDKTFYKQLCNDSEFIRKLKKRYAVLHNSYLSERYVYGVIDDTTSYLKSARAREWYRWAADYYDDSGKNRGNYYLSPYVLKGEEISRFNDNYDQEIYNIKVYLGRHGDAMQMELTKLADDTEVTSGIRGEIMWILLMVCALFLIPSVLINRK